MATGGITHEIGLVMFAIVRAFAMVSMRMDVLRVMMGIVGMMSDCKMNMRAKRMVDRRSTTSV